MAQEIEYVVLAGDEGLREVGRFKATRREDAAQRYAESNGGTGNESLDLRVIPANVWDAGPVVVTVERTERIVAKSIGTVRKRGRESASEGSAAV